MKKTILMMLIAAAFAAQGQTVQSLYPVGKIPNALDTDALKEKSQTYDGMLIVNGVTIPTLTAYYPPKGKENRTSIIIFPGGGYTDLAMGHEGSDIAKAFAELGVTAFVVKYRLPDARSMKLREIGPLQDGLRAIQIVRSHAKEWDLDPSRIGIIGFSAGGHLASTVGTKYKDDVLENPDKISLRADFMILAYPVISSNSTLWHSGSFANLLGEHASPAQLKVWSSEFNVTPETPPAFLFHASDDDVVKPQNSIVFYEALLANHVPAELHLYQAGGHGFGLRNPTTADRWLDRVANWMKANKFLP